MTDSATRRTSTDRYVLVVGGANVDLKCRVEAEVVMGTSNPGALSMSPGGVARNVAEMLAWRGVPTELVSVIGTDLFGEMLLDNARNAGLGLSGVVRSVEPTGTYTAVIDSRGELVLGVAAMDAMRLLTAERIDGIAGLISGASFVIADCNLFAEPLARVIDVANDAGVPVMVDPVSVPKSFTLRAALDGRRQLHTITPNSAELAALTGCDPDDEPSVSLAASSLCERGCENVWVRRGAAGSIFFHGNEAVRIPPTVAAPVLDVTGAGDALLAAYVHSMMEGTAPCDAARNSAGAATTVLSTIESTGR